MTELRKEVIAVLEGDWPTTLQGWDANEGEMHQRISQYWQGWNGRTTSTLVGTELDAIGPEAGEHSSYLQLRNNWVLTARRSDHCYSRPRM